MLLRLAVIAAAVLVPAAAHAQSSNTSSNSSSNNGVVRERIIDTYCDDGYCTRTVERNVFRDGSDRDWDDDREDAGRRFDRWALQNFDRDGNGRLSRREYARARAAYRRW